MKRTFFQIVFASISLVSCQNLDNNKMATSTYFIDDLSFAEISSLKCIDARVRDTGEVIDRFYVTIDTTTFHLPIIESTKSIDKIMNAEWYDVVKYAKANGIDSTSSFSFVKKYSDNVSAAFCKTKPLSIFGDPEGTYILFQYPSRKIVYIFSEEEFIHNQFKDSIFLSKKIKPHWFIIE